MDSSSDNDRTHDDRPDFPRRAVVTAGMPYGNKNLHFGHIGGVFVHADVFARFLRDRIGHDNVIFVSGTDCYGSPIVEDHRRQLADGTFAGGIDDFVKENHKQQANVLDAYDIQLDTYAASSFGRASEIHKDIGALILRSLHRNGRLEKLTTRQFFDTKQQVFLNGRQVVGRCPIQGCASETAYADECALGHQYEPSELIAPKSTLTGEVPEMRDAVNWYIDLPSFRPQLEQWLESMKASPACRTFVATSIAEFFEPPSVYITTKQLEALDEVVEQLPAHTREEGKSNSVRLVFNDLTTRESACSTLTANSIHYRKGKTLVPFRLTGNTEWGLPAPSLDGEQGLTFWVWPESLWAPISFTATVIERAGKRLDDWKDWWCSRESRVYQFIGEDNVYFYGPAQTAIFVGTQTGTPVADPPSGELQLTELVVNNHILFLDKKASSSGKVKPPAAADLLEYYTADQLRAHFFSLGLNKRSVGFRPKPLNPTATERDADPVMREGNLLSNVFNRAVRSCFYTLQTYYDGRLPAGEVSADVRVQSDQVILGFENLMYRRDFTAATTLLDGFIRSMNKLWDANTRRVKETDDDGLRRQNLIDVFHMVRVGTLLTHPIAPTGTEKIREYLNIGVEFWNWDRAFETLYDFIGDPAEHTFKVLEPRVDFFERHPSQVNA